jgi:hypothetical protein
MPAIIKHLSAGWEGGSVRRQIGWLLSLLATVAAVVFSGVWIWEYSRGRTDQVLARWASIAALIAVPIAAGTFLITLFLLHPGKETSSPQGKSKDIRAREVRKVEKVGTYIEIHSENPSIKDLQEAQGIITATDQPVTKEGVLTQTSDVSPLLRITQRGELYQVEVFDVDLAYRVLMSRFGDFTESADE